MSATTLFSRWVESFVDAPWIVTALLKMTIVLMIAWTLHFALRQANPRWRVILWRSAIIGVLAVATLDAVRIASLSWEIASPVIRDANSLSEAAGCGLFRAQFDG
ncbi:hypothetical protein Poly51_22830 [Rubripirellula tenax]|uniref:Uncharacterized protein n=1 Tax=Rubripirellula tenax TaxID=2528015 RepID=A0A5C6FDK0_9BACT|nr:hypothetical protein [Rubripirellula tenax]TWU59495.1 hypothetical protein Poly51_22830 [Rubripirellula tenax]